MTKANNSKPLAAVLQAREHLYLERPSHLAKALRCSRATIYRWLEQDPPKESLGYQVMTFIKERTSSADDSEFVHGHGPWGSRLRDAPTFKEWLDVLSGPLRRENPALRRKRKKKSRGSPVRRTVTKRRRLQHAVLVKYAH